MQEHGVQINVEWTPKASRHPHLYLLGGSPFLKDDTLYVDYGEDALQDGFPSTVFRLPHPQADYHLIDWEVLPSPDPVTRPVLRQRRAQQPLEAESSRMQAKRNPREPYAASEFNSYDVLSWNEYIEKENTDMLGVLLAQAYGIGDKTTPLRRKAYILLIDWVRIASNVASLTEHPEIVDSGVHLLENLRDVKASEEGVDVADMHATSLYAHAHPDDYYGIALAKAKKKKIAMKRRVICTFCKKSGHEVQTCYAAHPELRDKAKAEPGKSSYGSTPKNLQWGPAKDAK